jgi:hypothetical protein
MTPITLNFARLDMCNFILAQNPNTSTETLERLANDKSYYEVRRWVAKNPNTSPETLERLVDDDDLRVRYWIARNPNTPQYIKTYLKLAETVVELAQ